MKQYCLTFLKRGQLAASGGPLILAMIYGILVIPQRTLIKYSCGEQWIRKNKKAVVEDDEE